MQMIQAALRNFSQVPNFELKLPPTALRGMLKDNCSNTNIPRHSYLPKRPGF